MYTCLNCGKRLHYYDAGAEPKCRACRGLDEPTYRSQEAMPTIYGTTDYGYGGSDSSSFSSDSGTDSSSSSDFSGGGGDSGGGGSSGDF